MELATGARRPIAEVAKLALTQMRLYNVAVTPQNYHVWFEHLTGTNLQLSRAVDLILAAGKDFSSDVCEELYQRFIGQEHQRLLVKQIQHQTREMLKLALSEVRTASAGADDYGHKLDGYARDLSESDALDDIQTVVMNIISDTHSMAESSREVHKRLDEATRKAKVLEAKLAAAEADATRDGLTGLANRRGAEIALVRSLQEFRTSEEIFSVVVCDIDHFKRFNDTHGHLVGDAVLRLTATSLSDGIKGQDTAARWGGEEFLLILPATNSANARHVGESLRRRISIRKLRIVDTDAPLDPITMSFGIAQVRGGDDIDSLITRADKALYLAKKSGRNRVCSESEVEENAVVA